MIDISPMRIRPVKKGHGKRWTAVLSIGVVASGLLLMGLLPVAGPAYAVVDPVDLATASNYSVLAGTEVVNTLTTTMSGDLGVSPGTEITGFPPGIATGSTHIGDLVAAQAQSDRRQAYNDAQGRTSTAIGDSIGGLSFDEGVYHAAAALSVNGILTLDGHDDPNAVFIFQVGSALNTGAGSHVRLINSARACNVFWQVGSAATLGESSTFNGTLLGNAAATVGAQTIVHGRVLVRTSITLADNDFTTTDCGTAPPGDDVTGASGAGAGTGGVTGSSGAGAGTGGIDSVQGAGVGGGTGGIDSVQGAGAGVGGGTGGIDSVQGAGAGVGGGTGGIDSVQGAGVGGGTGGIGSNVTGSDVTGVASPLPGTGANLWLGPLLGLGLLLLVLGGVLVTENRQKADS